MSDTGPTPPPQGAEGDSAPQDAPQTPFHCAMPSAIPPRPRCQTQCSHCRHVERGNARILPGESDDGENNWALVDPHGNVLSIHANRPLAEAARERYLDGTSD